MIILSDYQLFSTLMGCTPNIYQDRGLFYLSDTLGDQPITDRRSDHGSSTVFCWEPPGPGVHVVVP